MDTKISVVIATLGTNAKIERAIKSVMNQTHQNLEIVLVVDKVPKLDFLNEGEKAKISIVAQRESGIYPNFNLGIEYSTGHFISILNDDDWYEQNFLETSVRLINDANVHGTYCDSLIYRPNEVVTRVRAKDDLSSGLLFDFIGAYHTTFLIQKSVFEIVGPFRTDPIDGMKILYANDYEWFIRAIFQGMIFARNPFCTGNFSIGGASTVNRITLIREARLIAIGFANSSFERTYLTFHWTNRLVWNQVKIAISAIAKVGSSYMKRILRNDALGC